MLAVVQLFVFCQDRVDEPRSHFGADVILCRQGIPGSDNKNIERGVSEGAYAAFC